MLRIACTGEGARTHISLLGKQSDLARVGWLFAWFTAAGGGASDNGKDCEFGERGAGYEDALGIGACVGRIDEVALGHELGEIVGHHAFELIVVFEAETDPEAFGARTGGEGFAVKFVGVAEVANEVNAFDVLQLKGDEVSGGV